MTNWDNKSRRHLNQSTGEHDRSFKGDPYIGFDLDGQYHIVELLGAGGWGNVYKGHHVEGGPELAIKIVHKHHMQHEQNLKRFQLETKLLTKLESPYIVKIIDHGAEPAPYIVMEYFDGEPLNNWIRENGRINPQTAIDLFMQLCDGMSAAQNMRIVHRDLKPANILLRISGGRVQAKILDFGLAKFIDSSTGGDRLTATGDVLGSPPYMSPEQWKGQCDSRSDIYALGCIMYEVLTGQQAFTAEYGLDYLNKHLSEKPKPISEILTGEKLPPGLEDIVSKCIQKTPANRYQSAAACKADLRKLKIGRKPNIILAEDEKTVKTKHFLVSGIISITLIAGLFLLREPIVHSICTQLYNQADSKLSMGQSDDAIGQFKQVLFLSQLLPEKDMQKLHALRTLAALLKDRKEMTASETLERQVDALTGGANTNPELAFLLQKANKSLESGDLSDAESQAKQALEMASTNPGKQSMGYSVCLDLLGKIACKQKSYDRAVTDYRESLRIAEAFLEPNSLHRASLMENLAAALKGAGNVEESDKYSALAMSLRNSGKIDNAEVVIKKALPANDSAASNPVTTLKTNRTNAPMTSNAPAVPTTNSAPHSQSASLVHALARKTIEPIHTPVASTPPPRHQVKPAVAKQQLSTAPASKSTKSHTQSPNGWGEMEKLRSFK